MRKIEEHWVRVDKPGSNAICDCRTELILFPVQADRVLAVFAFDATGLQLVGFHFTGIARDWDGSRLLFDHFATSRRLALAFSGLGAPAPLPPGSRQGSPGALSSPDSLSGGLRLPCNITTSGFDARRSPIRALHLVRQKQFFVLYIFYILFLFTP